MKTLCYLFVVIILFIHRTAFCDIIPENSHWVYKCAKIINANDFNNIYFIGYVPFLWLDPSESGEHYIINSSTCLSKGNPFNPFEIWAIEKGNFTEQEVLSFDYPNEYGAVKSNIQIYPNGGYIQDSIPIDSIAEFYRVMGFTWKNVIIYKWKEVFSFSNGQPDSVNYYEYDGDSTLLADHILGIENPVRSSGIVVSPNPVDNLLHVHFENYYAGSVTMSIVSIDGKLQDQFVFTKDSYEYVRNIDLMNMSKGIYFIKFDFGDITEVKRIIIY